jgi:putative endonuclease
LDSAAPPPKKHYVYIAECADGTLYAGYAVDVENRIKAHNDGKGAKYTKSRRPVRAVYSESFDSMSAALRREAEIKRLRRSAKMALIGSRESMKDRVR